MIIGHIDKGTEKVVIKSCFIMHGMPVFKYYMQSKPPTSQKINEH